MKLFPQGSVLLAAGIWLWLTGGTLAGIAQGVRAELPDFDRRNPQNLRASDVENSRHDPVAELRRRVPGVKVEFDPLTGSPAWVAATDGFLAGTNGTGGVSRQGLLQIGASDEHRVLRAFLREHREVFGHGPEVLDNARVKRDYTGTNNGMRTVVWEQQADGIPIFESLLIAHTTKRGELVNVSSHFLPDAEAAANANANRSAMVARPGVTAAQALEYAARSIGDVVPAAEVSARTSPRGSERRQTFGAARLKGEANVSLVWLPMNRDSLRLCWDVILASRGRSEMFRVLIDATTGEPLLRRSLTENISNASYRVFTGPSPAPFTLGFPTNMGGAVTISGYSTPATNQPPVANRTLVVTSALDTNASPHGWIDDGTNVTASGNNVTAYLDAYADDLPDVPPPQGTTNRVFDYPLDLTQDPVTYSNTSVVSLFYWNNWMHDRLYELGFTEAAGNFQITNFGRGGLGGDPVHAEAQDGYYLNDPHYLDNASFSTPPDGQPGRMEMFVFLGPTPSRDADFDTEVILHEYAHGLSGRRVGGGVGISELQSRGLGEGWSDFYSLALLAQSNDDVNACYPEGPYVSYLLFAPTYTFTQNYYFGIRRYPYSTDTNKDPVTFKDIDPGQADPHGSVPINPTIVNPAAEVHNQGEIWCAALWDARANLINKYGFATGNQLILQLVTDGLGLTPANPTFVQARDAILQADLVDNNAVNYQALWAAFAKRGLGRDAIAPANTTTTGVTESFAAPDPLLISPGGNFAASGPIFGPFTPPSQTYGLHNTSSNAMGWSAGASVPWVTLSSTSGTLASTGSATNILLSLNSGVNTLLIGNYNGTVSFTNQATAVVQTFSISLTVSMPVIYSYPLDSDPGWSRQGQWAFGHPTGQGGAPHGSNGNPDPAGGATGSNVFGVNLNGDYSTNPLGPFYLTAGPLDFSTSGSVALQFQRWLNSDYTNYAFATVDVSSDGTNWTTVFINSVPQLPITDSSWTKCQYDISMVADHQPTVYVRWGYQTTSGVFAYSGWNIDDIQFLGLSQITVTLPISATEGAGLLAGQGHVSVPQAPATNLIIQLSSDNPAKLSVASTATILSGQTNANFDLTVSENFILDGTQIIHVSGSADGYAAGMASVPIFDNETATLSVSLPSTATEGDGVLSGTVTVSAPVAADVAVSLTSSDPNSLAVPATVTVPNGQTSIGFSATVIDDHRINGDHQATVTAHVQNWTDGMATVTIHDNENTNVQLMLPAQVRESNGTLTNAGSVRISGTLTTNLIVSMLSSNTAKVTLPSTVTILAGQTFAQFNVTAVAGNLPHAAVDVGVTATAAGFNGATVTINVADNQTPPPPILPHPPDLSATNPINITLSWSPGVGEGVERVVNGGFESGNLAGWTNPGGTNSGFVINDGTIVPPSGDAPSSPFAGAFSAVADAAAPSSSMMYQDVFLPTNAGTITLSWVDRVRNFNINFATNQQFRVTVMDTSNNILAVAFSTQAGDTQMAGWTQRGADLTTYAGRTVRIVFEVTAMLDYLDVYVDKVCVKCSTLPAPMYDVYFGTFGLPGLAQFQGSTSNTYWPVAPVAPYTTYYWQIVARRSNQTASAVWQFSSLPTLYITNTSVMEGDQASTTNAVFAVNFSGGNSLAVSVDYFTANGTAVSPNDYSGAAGILTFNPGDTNTQYITVNVNGNNLPEPNKTFFIKLANVINGALWTNQATATILNDDHYPTIQTIAISAGQATVTWTSDSGKTYRLQYSDDLTGGWNDVTGDVLATGSTAFKTDFTASGPHRYYRVMMVL